MRGIIFGLLALLLAADANAQVCAGNVDQSGNVCTTFTLGTPTSNCIPVLTQDGQAIPQYSGAVCPNGFFGGSGMQVTLPNDPTNPGYALTMYECTTATVSNTIPPYSTTPQPSGTLTLSLSCTVNYSYTATWSGLLDYNYDSVYQVRCVGGRGAHCVRGYFPVWASGDGEISTPPPPATTSTSTTIPPGICGDGTLDPGEQCDDGAANGLPGDCCTATCQFQAAGTPCADDGDLCTLDVCDAANTCTHSITPSPTCVPPNVATGASLLLRTLTPGKNEARFKWGKGPVVPLTDFGDPTGGELIRLCVYDEIGPGTYALALGGSPSVSSGGAWTGSSTGWKFKSTTGVPDGITRVTLKAGTTPLNAKVQVKATNSPAFAAFPLHQDPSVVAQVKTSLATCWGATFSTPTANTATEFKAKSD